MRARYRRGGHWDDEVGVEVFPLPSPTRQPKLHAAVFLLYRELAGSTPALWPPWGYPRPVPSSRLLEAAASLRISERTLRAAKELCLVEDGREGFGPGSVPYWLPPKREFTRWLPAPKVLDRLREERARGRSALGSRHQAY